MWRAYRPILRTRVQRRSTSSQSKDPYEHVQARNGLIGGVIGTVAGLAIFDDKRNTFADNLVSASVGMVVGAVMGMMWPIAVPLVTVVAAKTYWQKRE